MMVVLTELQSDVFTTCLLRNGENNSVCKIVYHNAVEFRREKVKRKSQILKLPCYCEISEYRENDFFSFSVFSKIMNSFSGIENEKYLIKHIFFENQNRK